MTGAQLLLWLGMAEKQKLPAHSLVGRIVMVIVAIWLVIWMLRVYVL